MITKYVNTRYIRERLKRGQTVKSIAKHYNMDVAQVQRQLVMAHKRTQTRLESV